MILHLFVFSESAYGRLAQALEFKDFNLVVYVNEI